MCHTKNFKYLDDLIHSGINEIVLDSDMILSDDEESEYLEGIDLDVDDIIIDGNGYTIDACKKTRIFTCTGRNILIKNITLKNGFTEMGAGAIYNAENSILTIMNSTFNQNMATGLDYGRILFGGTGGAIINQGELCILRSSFNENIANNNGGAISNAGNLRIIGSKLNKNKTKSNDGAINNSYEAKLSIIGSTLNGNISEYRGGAIYNDFLPH